MSRYQTPFTITPVILRLVEVVLTDQVSDHVKRLLAAFRGAKTLKATELMERLGLQHRPIFRNNYLTPALAAGLIVMTDPDSPRSQGASAIGWPLLIPENQP